MLRVRYVCGVGFLLGLGVREPWERVQRLALRRPRSLSDALRGVRGAAIVAGGSRVASQLSNQCWILSCLEVDCRASAGVIVCDDGLDGGGEAARALVT